MSRRLFLCIGLFLAAGILLVSSWSSSDLQRMTRWHVEVDPSKPKADQEYDAIIVGSGFGGLSCGAMLAKHGYKVLVLEKNPVVGGLCSSYEKDGFRFCYGAEDICGLDERGSLKYLFRQLGLSPAELFVPNSHTFFDGVRPINVTPGEDSFEKAVAKIYPKEENNIRRFFAKAKEVYAEGYDTEMVQKWGIIVPEELIPQAMPETWIKNYGATHKNLAEWSQRPYQDVLDEYFTSQELKTVLCGYVSYLGGFPYNTPASSVVVKTFEFLFYGGYQALGTPQHVAEAFARFITQHGGSVQCEKPVKKIVVGRRGVKGVIVGDHTYEAPVVVCNVNTKTAYFDLLDPDDVPPDFLKELWSLPLGASALSLHLAVDHPLLSYASIIQDRSNHVYLAIPSKNDPSVAPEGKSICIARETVRFSSFIHNTKEENEQYVQQRGDDLLTKAKALVPELKKGVVVEKVVTPNVFAELASVPYGAIYGFDQSAAGAKPGFRAPIRGLYMSSASSGGAGVEPVVATGILCAHDIMGWKY